MALGRYWDVEDGDYFAMSRMIEAIDKARGAVDAGEEAATPVRTRSIPRQARRSRHAE
jgi:hypothetical protein